jgi:hypothetical protein
MKVGFIYSFILATLLLASCSSSVEKTSEVALNVDTSAPQAVQQPSSKSIATLTENIKFKSENGSEKFTLKPASNGAKLVDATERELARLTVDPNQKIKIKNAQDQVLGYVVHQGDHWKLENPDQIKELYILRRQADGDYKLEDGTNRQLYRIKSRDYGFEIEAPPKQSLYKVKVKGDKISLRNPNEQTVLYTKSNFLPIAIACFGFDALSQEQQAALAYAVNTTGGQ